MSDDLYHKKITEGLKRLSAMYGPEAIIPANVTKVDSNEFTFDCITDDDIIIPEVLYKSVSGGNIDVVMQPAVGSRIYIGRVGNSDEWILIKCGVIDAFMLKINDTMIKATSAGLEFNNGTLGGLVKRDGLKNRLNAIEDDINKLKQFMLSWTPTPGDGGAALKLLISNWGVDKLKKTVNSDIENLKVKQ